MALFALPGAAGAQSIASATYNASNGVLSVTGSGMTAGDTIAVDKLTLTGEGGSTYTLTGSAGAASSDTAFSVTLNGTDEAALNRILNKNGTSSTGGTPYNLAAADDWDANVTTGDTSDSAGNGVTVSNVAVPTIASATYNAASGALAVIGAGFSSNSGANNDIVANKFTVTGNGGASWTLTDSANVDIASGTGFTLFLSSTDRTGLAALIDKDGSSSTGGTTYNLAAAEDWAAGADPAVAVADTIGNGITASNTDGTPPTVSSVGVPANGTYLAGDNLDFMVNFSEAVIVNTGGGTPRVAITLDTGGTVYANYISGSGTSALTFRYTVASGDQDSDGIAVGSLSGNGGTLKDAAGNDAGLTLNSVGSTAAVLVDAVVPSVSSVGVPANDTYVAGANLDFTVNFSEAVTVNTGGGTPRIALTLDTGGTVYADYLSGSGTSALTFRYTVGVGALDTDGIAVGALNGNGGTLKDDVGNNATLTLNSVGSTTAVLVDAVAPSVSSITRVTSANTNASSVDYTVTFAEDVSGVDTSDFSLTTSGTAAGSIAAVNQVDASTYTVTVNPISGDGTLRLDLKGSGTGITDIPGNAIAAGYTSGQVYSLDHTVPTVTSVGVPANATYGAGDNLDFTVNFNEAVTVNTGGGTPRIAITLDTGGTVYANYVSGSGTSALTFRYTVASGTQDSNGITVGSLSGNGGTLKDAAGNDAGLTLNSVGSTAAVLVDAVVPSASIVIADTALAVGETSTVTIIFSEAVSGFSNADLTVANGSLSSVSSSDGGMTWTATFTPAADVTDAGNLITLDNTGVQDATGNSGTGTTDSNNYAIDTLRPTAVVVVADTALAPGETSTVTITYNEVVSGFTNADLTVSNGSLGAVGSSDGGVTWTATLTPVVVAVDDISNVITLDNTGVQDAAGNTGTGTTDSNNYAVLADGAAPVVASVGVPANGTYLAGDNLDFTVNFSEAVIVNTGGGTPRVAITLDIGGTVHANYISGSGTSALTFRYTIASGDQDSNGIAVGSLSGNGGTLRDAAGNDADLTLNNVGSTAAVLVGQAAQTITFGAQAAQAFVPGGTFDLNPVATASSGLAVAYSSQTTAVCTISGTTVTMLSAGSCTIAADQAGDTDHAAATTVTQSITIGEAGQAITFGAQAAQTFVPGGTFDLNPVATASSGLALAYSSQTTAVCTISGITVTMLSAGSCTIAANQTGDDNYAAATTVTQSIAIGQAVQAITGFAANPVAPVFAPNGTFTVSATGGASGKPVVFGSATPTVCLVAGNTVTILSAGTCSLTAGQAGTTSYSAAPQVSLDVTIAAAVPTLSWIGALQKVVGEDVFELPEPASDSDGAFTFSSQNPAVATVSGREVTIVGPGTATLVATQAATGNYTQGSVSTTLTVSTRPDPTRDPEVVGGLQAQVDASVRFANAQQNNIHDRLRQLRDGSGNPSANHLAFNVSGGRGPGLSFNAGQLDGGGMPALAQGWGLWAAGTISLGQRDARGGSGGFDFRSDGVTLGVDRLVNPHVLLGVAGGLGWNDTDFDDSPSQQDARQRSVALYGLWRGDGQLFADAILGLGRLDFDLLRWSAVAEITASAQRTGRQTFASLTWGYEHAGERSRVTGYGRYDASHTTLDAYRESGLGIYDLAYDRQSVDNSTLALGVEGSYVFAMATSSLRPYWSLEYRQALQNRGDAGLNYVVQPLAQGYVLGLRSYNDDTLALGAGLDIDLDSGWNLSFLLRREQSADAGDANSFGVRVSYGQLPGANQAMRGGMLPAGPGSGPMPGMAWEP